MTTSLPSLPPVKQLSTSVWRILGGNPSKFTLQGTNTYLLGTGRRRILIDSAQGFPVWPENLRVALQQAASQSNTEATTDTRSEIEITDCILTHWHLDHVLGLSDLLSVFPKCRIWKHHGSSCDPDGNLTSLTVRELHDGQILSVGDEDFKIRVVHTPGHTIDHVVLQIVASRDTGEVGALFTADNVLGHGTAVFEDLGVYIASLQKMLGVLDEYSPSTSTAALTPAVRDQNQSNGTIKAYPAHGEIILDAAAKINEYISHRALRETEAMNVLLHGSTTEPSTATTKTEQETETWTSMAMVKVIYAAYPVDLHGPAEGSLLQVLRKLEADGRVRRVEGGWKAVVLEEQARNASKNADGSGKL